MNWKQFTVTLAVVSCQRRIASALLVDDRGIGVALPVFGMTWLAEAHAHIESL